MDYRKPHFPIGTISHGTLIAEDIADSLIYTVQTYVCDSESPVIELIAALATMRESMTPENEQETLEDMIEECFLWLPAYTYLGMLEGDGSDLGVWPSDELMEHDIRDGELLAVSDTGKVPYGYTGYVLQVSDHGNRTLYEAVDGTLSEQWSIV